MSDPRSFPVLLIVRQRLSLLRGMLQSLRPYGFHKVLLLDQRSNYPPLLDYYGARGWEQDLPGSAVHLHLSSRNYGKYALWADPALAYLESEWLYYSDPDLALEAPSDLPQKLFDVARSANLDKVGVSLRIDDLPDYYAHKARVVAWESRFWDSTLLMPQGFYRAPVDTTFALYRPGCVLFPAHVGRLAAPYTARHLPWYEDTAHPTEEHRYYDQTIDRSFKPDSWSDLEGVPYAGKLRSFDAPGTTPQAPPAPPRRQRVRRRPR